VQYTREAQWKELEMVVYPGADASFTLYEDEGDSYRYEQGQRATIRFQWNERSGQLTIAQREGTFPGMLQQRTFRVRMAGTDTIKTVEYNGQEIKLDMK
jgi:alpha-D-xyloside xylohydrolase